MGGWIVMGVRQDVHLAGSTSEEVRHPCAFHVIKIILNIQIWERGRGM